MFLKLRQILYPVYNLGPGKRIALWTQGCSIHCPDCLNPETWNPEAGVSVNIMSLAILLMEISEGYDGITFSGGEPFDQYDALVYLASILKHSCKLNLLVYSGYTLEELSGAHPDLYFQEAFDYLIDGRFRSNSPSEDNIRGSANQRIYQFAAGEVLELPTLANGTALSVNLDTKAILSGIPKAGDVANLKELLAKRGLTWE
ncbi:MAG TPA: 4Fe-4S single cluster domain-containing protein [Candidatus Cloacimonadota bacterium]|nr:4Fe-4S single cluster domain-containing protein [Candidatus Cloacimonadota bacterium]